MERIIIKEVDNTSNVEALSSYDVAYVPGFARGTGDLSPYYRTPILIRDKYEFVQKFGADAPTFKSGQPYPEEFADVAKKFGNETGAYYPLDTNNFTSIAEAVDTGYYDQVTEAISELATGTTYYRVTQSEGIFSLAALTTVAQVVTIVGKSYFTFTANEVSSGFVEGVQYYTKTTESSKDTYTPYEGTPTTGDYYTLTDITPFTGDAWGSDTYFEYTVDNGVYAQTSDSKPKKPTDNEWCLSSTVNPQANVWYVMGSKDYEVTSDTHIDPETIYNGHEEGVPFMFEAGDADPGYRYAYTLLSMGMPVYFEVMNSTYREESTGTDDVTVENMYAGIKNRFVPADPKVPDLTFDSMGDYSVKFITTGGYPTFEYDNNGLAEAMMSVAQTRQDSIALIDHTDNPVRNLTVYDEDSVITAVRNWSFKDDAYGTYGAMFTPWYECSSPTVTAYIGDDGNPITNNTMPGSLAYLTTLCAQLLNYNPWLAVSGVARGKVPYMVKLHTDKPLTNNIADSYQALPNDETVGSNINISINPITYIRNYGYCIWGNRTLRNNAGGTKASSFLNIRSAVSDIKKRLFEASQSLLFEQNTDVLWVNFKSLVVPLLDTMKADYILDDYAVTRLFTDPLTGALVPAYEVMAVIRIQPINSVEIFDLTVYMENSDEFNITTSEVE